MNPRTDLIKQLVDDGSYPHRRGARSPRRSSCARWRAGSCRRSRSGSRRRSRRCARFARTAARARSACTAPSAVRRTARLSRCSRRLTRPRRHAPVAAREENRANCGKPWDDRGANLRLPFLTGERGHRGPGVGDGPMDDSQGGGRRKKAAEELILRTIAAHAESLLRTARRHSICVDDAQDAYQRAIEIFMSHAARLDAARAPALAARRRQARGAGDPAGAAQAPACRREVDLDGHEARPLPTPDEQLLTLRPDQPLGGGAASGSSRTSCARCGCGRRGTATATSARSPAGRTRRSTAASARAGGSFLEHYEGIESGEECERWLPVLSAMVDGEATPGAGPRAAAAPAQLPGLPRDAEGAAGQHDAARRGAAGSADRRRRERRRSGGAARDAHVRGRRERAARARGRTRSRRRRPSSRRRRRARSPPSRRRRRRWPAAATSRSSGSPSARIGVPRPRFARRSRRLLPSRHPGRLLRPRPGWPRRGRRPPPPSARAKPARREFGGASGHVAVGSGVSVGEHASREDPGRLRGDVVGGRQLA